MAKIKSNENYLRFKKERTLVLIKPDGVERKLIGEIISRIERTGLKIIGLGVEIPTRKKIDGHYPKDIKWIKRLGEKSLGTYEKYGIDPKKVIGTDDLLKIGEMIRQWIIDFMTSGPIVKIAVEGPHAIDVVRKLAGNTLPYLADSGTIRGDFSSDSPILGNLEKRSVANIIHASETPEEARHEINYWFKENELLDYN